MIAAVAIHLLTSWQDADGNDRDDCACGHHCSSHPYAVHRLLYCADCDAPTCPHCRELVHDVPICLECAAEGPIR